MSQTHQSVLILDFGSQYTQLIARRVRQLNVYCEIRPFSIGLDTVKALNPAAIILSGGPSSVYGEGAPDIEKAVLDIGLPILGICYGAQLLAKKFGGKVVPSEEREYGYAKVTKQRDIPGVAEPLLSQFEAGEDFDVWMSHGDRIEELPPSFVSIAHTESTPFAAIAHVEKPVVGLQFHPEVSHTPQGIEILKGFLFGIANFRGDWTMSSFVEEQQGLIRGVVKPGEKVICGLSGGVDSSVVSALLRKAIGDDLVCIMVDNGLLRHKEVEGVREAFTGAGLGKLRVVDARDEFMDALKGIEDPELKRKTVGKIFIDVFERESTKIEGAKYLAQGTLYPDVIESVSVTGGPSVTIKSHHNVGGLPEKMNLSLIEPLRDLFKDEVRLVGLELGLPREICFRQPFPGPGLSVRIPGEVTFPKCETLRAADAIIMDEIVQAGLYEKCWQTFGVLLPVLSVGVMGDERTYENALSVRSVDSVDGMTADWSRLPYDVLGRISNRVINEVRGINRVLYDISSKPPATIEWE
ncbi:MAG: glutamine-hydrolyzing GMP synthase [Myxococcota bacterium]|nr:glutamine-hydrolyzing GMP synthase [Myxococcota bacterium]